MVQFPGIKTVEAGFPMLVQLCDAVTKAFSPSYIMLQAEKAMRRTLMINKKRYIYECMMGPTAKAELAYKGVELARRDNCPLVAELMTAVIAEIMSTGDAKKARVCVDNTLRKLLGGRVDIGKLVVTKSISKDDYKSDPIQLVVAKRMAARDPSYEYGVGERIPYVIVRRPGKTLADRAEDPLWAISHGMGVDEMYYINNQLAAPVSRILMWTMLSSDERKAVDTHEKAIRAAEETGANVEPVKKKLTKLMEKLREKVQNTLFGPGALAAHPRKVERSEKHGIGAFFTPVSTCPVCRHPLDKAGKCKGCSEAKCRECKGSVPPGTELCDKCESEMTPCARCYRGFKKLADETMCKTCSSGMCWRCSTPTRDCEGLCQECRRFHGTLTAGKAAMVAGDIEDMEAQAAELKAKCDKCRGYPSDEINCVARDCPTLYQRATVAVRIKAQANKK
jgi:hypothetical protein